MAEQPKRTASPSQIGGTNGTISHRSSFAENMRSPRSQRHPSFTQSALQELLNHPPAHRSGDARFFGRDWRHIRVGELVDQAEVRWAKLEDGVEATTKVSAPSQIMTEQITDLLSS